MFTTSLLDTEIALLFSQQYVQYILANDGRVWRVLTAVATGTRTQNQRSQLALLHSTRYPQLGGATCAASIEGVIGSIRWCQLYFNLKTT